MSSQEVENEHKLENEANSLPTNLYDEQKLIEPKETSEIEVALHEKTKPHLRKDEVYEGKIISRNLRGFLIVDCNGHTVTVYDPEESSLFPPSYVPSRYDYKPETTVVFKLTSNPDRAVLWGELLYKKK